MVGSGLKPERHSILQHPSVQHPSAAQVLEEPEPEAKLVKPPPVAVAPVETFTPKAGWETTARLVTSEPALNQCELKGTEATCQKLGVG